MDVRSPRALRRRTYRWLRVRILGLLDAPPTFIVQGNGRPLAIPTTRLLMALDPPQFDQPDPDTQGGAQHGA